MIVVGAGFAGLAAADALAAAGVEVVVLEARDRVGGRVHSSRLANGALVELGGEFITAGYTTTEAFADRLGLELDGMGINYPDRELLPGPRPPAPALEAAARAAAELAAAEPGAQVEEVLRHSVPDDDARTVLAMRLQSALAYPVAELAASFLLKAPGLVDTEQTRRVRGGNQTLALELARGLGERVRLGTAVREIRSDPGGVRVVADHVAIDGRACIVTVPLALLPAMRFDPPLPKATRRAAASIPTSTAAKLAVPLQEPVEPRAPMSASDRFWAWTTPIDEVGCRSVGAWAGSAPTVAGLSVAAGPGEWLQRLAHLWPELELQPDGASLTVWADDPWARGAYSVLPPVLTEPAEAIATSPAPNLLIAGEHTAEPGWTGTMEGALRSGLRAAGELLGERPGLGPSAQPPKLMCHHSSGASVLPQP